MERESRILDRETLRRERNCRWFVRYDSIPPSFLLSCWPDLEWSVLLNNKQSTKHVRIQAFHTYPYQYQCEEVGGNSVFVRQPWACPLWALISKVLIPKWTLPSQSPQLSLCTNQREWHFDAIIRSLLIEQTCATDRSKWVTCAEKSHRFVCTENCMTLDRQWFVCDLWSVWRIWGFHCWDWLALGVVSRDIYIGF